MNKILLTSVVLVSVVFSFQIFQEDEPVKIHNEQLSKTFLSKHIPIIDIRTKKEWERTGVVEDSILLTFYNKDGRFDENKFLRNLDVNINKDNKFAILSRTGKESNKVARLLKSKGYLNVTNLTGGIKQGAKNHIVLVKYDGKNY